MQTYNIEDSRLIDDTVNNGEPFVIAKVGKPMEKVIPIDSTAEQPKRIGFMKGPITVPDDFDTMGSDEIGRMFEGGGAGSGFQ